MNTEDRSLSLRAGQALEVEPHVPATLYLLEGELLVQPPATWLAGRVIVAPARRVAAPAVLQSQDIAAATAATTLRLRVQRPAGLLQRLKRSWSAQGKTLAVRTAN